MPRNLLRNNCLGLVLNSNTHDETVVVTRSMQYSHAFRELVRRLDKYEKKGLALDYGGNVLDFLRRIANVH